MCGAALCYASEPDKTEGAPAGLPLCPQVAASTYRELQPDVAAWLAPLGSLPLQCCPGEAEEEQMYTLHQFRDLPLTRPGDGRQEGGSSGGACLVCKARKKPPERLD